MSWTIPSFILRVKLKDSGIFESILGIERAKIIFFQEFRSSSRVLLPLDRTMYYLADNLTSSSSSS
jgi:hypothetical protein